MLRFIYNMSDLTKNITLRVVFALVTLLVVLLVYRSDSFIGVLENNDFTVLEENYTYDLLRVVNDDTNTVGYALYSKDLDYSFDFYQSSDLLLRVDTQLLEDEYYLFTLPTEDLENVTLTVSKGEEVIDIITFLNTLTYESARLVMFDYSDYNELLLQSNIETTSLIIDILKDEHTSTIQIVLLILGPIVLLCLPYGYLTYQIKLPKVKRVLSLIFIDLILSLVFCGLILAIAVAIWGVEEEVMGDYDVSNSIEVETDEFTLKTTIGLTQSFWLDGSKLEVTYHITLLTPNDDTEYISNFVLDTMRFRGVQSIEESRFFVEDLVDIFPNDEGLESENYQIEVREKRTGVLVFTSESAVFYTDTVEAIEGLDLAYDNTGSIISIGVFLSFFLIIVPILIYVTYRKTKKSSKYTFWSDDNQNDEIDGGLIK